MSRPEPDATALFGRLRPRLTRIAYRMLGSVAEAEDIVQDAYIRWHHADHAAVRDPPAYLTRTVTRLCLDHLKSARVRREQYVGPWLPEPVLDDANDGEDRDDITLTLMVALERLSPLERAAFLLHDVFGVGFREIARTLDRDAAACRQLCRRARAHVRAARPRFPVPEEHAEEIALAFHDAVRSGDVTALQRLLSEDVVVYTDGGGRESAALKPILGRAKAARFFAALVRKYGKPPAPLHRGSIDGLPGFVTEDANGVLQTTALAVENGRVSAIFIVRNPDKLRHVEAALKARAAIR